MFVLKISGTVPPLYVSIENGFIEKTDSQSQALQLARNGDAQAMQTIVIETTDIVTL